MAIGLDTPSFVALGDSFVVLPATALSATRPSGVSPVFQFGSGTYEAVNWGRVLALPGVVAGGRAHKHWLTAANLNKMFVTRTNGLVGSYGATAYLVGANASADQVFGNFDKSFISALTLNGGGRGDPITYQIGIAPAGTSSAMPTLYSGLDITAVQSPNTGVFMSEGVSFSPALTDVISWTLTLTNSLVPDTACQSSTTSVNSSTRLYPTGYISGPIGVGLTVQQRTGTATPMDSGSALDALYVLAMTLQSTEVGGTGTSSVTLSFQGLIPDESSTVELRDSRIFRTMVGQAGWVGGTPTFQSKIVIS